MLETSEQIDALDQRILNALKCRITPIVASNTCLIYDVAEYARGAALRIITGGSAGDYDRKNISALGIEI